MHAYSFKIVLFISLSQDIEYNPLCYKAGPCSLSVQRSLYLLTPNSRPFPPPAPSPLENTRLVSVSASVSVLKKGAFVPCFRFHI